MFTYQLQERIINALGTTALPTWPATIAIEIKLGPPQLFGSTDEWGRTYVHGRENPFELNGNTGRVRFRPNPPLETLHVAVSSPKTRFELHGDLIRYEAPCESLDQLIGCLYAIHLLYPALLNIEFAEPPVVLWTRGTINGNEFRWEQINGEFGFRPMSPEGLQVAAAEAFQRLDRFHDEDNRRLAVAVHYFHHASRLIVSGNSDWEFMPEAILNLAKCLEMLFGDLSPQSMDAVRLGLARLGYSADEIETGFIPLLVLRGHFDVAHVKLTKWKAEQLKVIYTYLAGIEEHFRELFRRLFKAIEDGKPVVPVHHDLEPDRDAQKKMDRLVQALAARIQRAVAHPSTETEEPSGAD